MEKPACLITGGTDGVGKFTAIELAKKGFTVVLAARNGSKAEAVKREIASASGATEVDYIVANLGSLDQVRRLADTFKQRCSRLDVLINNAGVFMPERQVTADGFELSYQVNYLSHLLLTHFPVSGTAICPIQRSLPIPSTA
jgi:retinol dehydrogenase 12